jgi:hypothetical protein
MTRTRITTDGITDATVTTAKIVDAAVTTAKLADSDVTTAKIADSAITSAKLAADSVITVDIANGNVTYAKIQNVSATDRLLGRSSAGAGVVEEIICTAQGRALIDDATAADQRTTLGLGTMATQATTSYLAVAGGTMTGVVQVNAGTAAAPGLAISGDTDTGITQAGGANTLSVATAGVERWRMGSDGAVAAMSVGDAANTLRPVNYIRAWARFNGGLAGTNAAIRSFNVTSVTRVALGVYTLNLATALSSDNGVAVASAVENTSGTNLGNFNNVAAAVVVNSTTVRVATMDITNVLADVGIVSVIVCDL